jgi:hypothetical protein
LTLWSSSVLLFCKLTSGSSGKALGRSLLLILSFGGPAAQALSPSAQAAAIPVVASSTVSVLVRGLRYVVYVIANSPGFDPGCFWTGQIDSDPAILLFVTAVLPLSLKLQLNLFVMPTIMISILLMIMRFLIRVQIWPQIPNQRLRLEVTAVSNFLTTFLTKFTIKLPPLCNMLLALFGTTISVCKYD